MDSVKAVTIRSAASGARGFYDRISPAYDLVAASRERAARELGLEALRVSPGQRVLEVGCGTGHALVRLAHAVGRTGHVHGTDLSSGMMAVARRRIHAAELRNVSFSLGDARKLSFRSSAFDAVFMSFTLELFEQGIPDVLAEVSRVLRVGGRVGIVAMCSTDQMNGMMCVYEWLHRRWPEVIACRPMNVVGSLQMAQFYVSAARATTIWGLPVIAAVGMKASTCA